MLVFVCRVQRSSAQTELTDCTLRTPRAGERDRDLGHLTQIISCHDDVMTWPRGEKGGEEGHSAASTRQLSLASPTGSGKNSGHLRTLNFVSVCRLQGYRKSMKRCQMCQKKRAVCPSQGQIPLRRGSGRELNYEVGCDSISNKYK